jgi:hypothetical protein
VASTRFSSEAAKPKVYETQSSFQAVEGKPTLQPNAKDCSKVHQLHMIYNLIVNRDECKYILYRMNMIVT